MNAYKFLAGGAVGPFTGFRWPRPGPGGADWVTVEAGVPEDRWVHACRTRDLPYWFGDELWAVELADPVRAATHQLASPRARLVEHLRGWDDAAKRDLTVACAWRARELALPHLAPRVRESLAGARDLAALAVAARAAAPGAAAAGYVATVAHKGALLLAASAGTELHRQLACASTAAFVAAALAGAVGGEDGFDAERGWQARWLADRLGLTEH
jgi:hypothetical protein